VLTPALGMLGLLAVEAWSISGSAGAPRMNPGTVFFEGNGALASGISAQYPATVRALAKLEGAEPDPEHVAYRRVARAELRDPQLGAAAANRLWASRALSFAADHPGRWLELERAKLVRTFHGFAWHDTPQAWAFDLDLGRWPALPLALLAALGLVGLLTEMPAARRAAPLYALLFVQLGVVLLFYTSARQRLVLVAPLYYFAASAVAALSDRATAPRRRAGGALLVALLALALALPTAATRREQQERGARLRASARLDEALAARAAGNGARFRRAGDAVLAHGARWLDELWPAALAQEPELAAARAATLVEAVLRDPSAPRSELDALRLDGAALWLAAERPERALSLLAGPTPRGARAAVLTTRALALGGRRDEAVRTLHAALAARPGAPALLAELTALGDAEEAARSYRCSSVISVRARRAARRRGAVRPSPLGGGGGNAGVARRAAAGTRGGADPPRDRARRGRGSRRGGSSPPRRAARPLRRAGRAAARGARSLPLARDGGRRRGGRGGERAPPPARLRRLRQPGARGRAAAGGMRGLGADLARKTRRGGGSRQPAKALAAARLVARAAGRRGARKRRTTEALWFIARATGKATRLPQRVQVVESA
jgi:hypothetical protein